MKRTLGVVVARLQVARLHEGHLHLITEMQHENDDGLILIGDRTKVAGRRNPLPYSVRRAMVKETFPDLAVLRLWDTPSNERWSHKLDEVIQANYPDHDVTLYCSRDGFADYYSGSFPVKVIDEHPAESGTEQRARIVAEIESDTNINHDFRRGYIAASTMRFPIIFSTVDVAVMNKGRTHIWLGQKKEDCGKWRFIGGFVDPTDTSRRAAAEREATEELGNIKFDNFTHVDSMQVNDFRYRDEPDGVMTDLFIATHTWGKPTASDDLDAIGWFPTEELMERLIPSHQQLGQRLLEYLEGERK